MKKYQDKYVISYKNIKIQIIIIIFESSLNINQLIQNIIYK